MALKLATTDDMYDYMQWQRDAHYGLVALVDSLGRAMAESEIDYPFDQAYRNGLLHAVSTAVNAVPGWVGITHGATIARAAVAEGHRTIKTERG